MRSQYVCGRCGLPIRWWLGKFWKHSAGWHSKKSCGQRPLPIKR